jgi:hypothetical protein
MVLLIIIYMVLGWFSGGLGKRTRAKEIAQPDYFIK